MDNVWKDRFYTGNKTYYDRNASRYEASSWYFFNRYKDDAVTSEIRRCLTVLRGCNRLSVLEIGPGTGYLLGKLIKLCPLPIHYTGIEHSSEMAKIVRARYADRCASISLLNETVTDPKLADLLEGKSYHLIMGSSILHHLLDYGQIVRKLAAHLKSGGVLYFVREPIHKSECEKSSFGKNIISKVYDLIDRLYLTPFSRGMLFPSKIKAEDASQVAFHMFKEGVGASVFYELIPSGYDVVFERRYNRRASSFFSLVENKWLKGLRKDIFRNTLFSICIRRQPARPEGLLTVGTPPI